ncbi:hypothetical protein AX16_002525 [Volvariella volvacea WC 439]|nr:hypothetical protein AX16_002525 [Volvariella volvacea WC 439]
MEVKFESIGPDGIESLNRCNRVQRISMKWGDTPSASDSVMLPNFGHLKLEFNSWLGHLQFPSLSFMEISVHDYPKDVELASSFTHFTSAQDRFTHLTPSTTTQLYTIELPCQLYITIKGETNEYLARVKIKAINGKLEGPYRRFFAAALDFARTACIDAKSLDIKHSSTSGSRSFFSALHRHLTSVHMDLRRIEESLKTLIPDIRTLNFDHWIRPTIERLGVLLEWLGDRNQKGLELENLQLRYFHAQEMRVTRPSPYLRNTNLNTPHLCHIETQIAEIDTEIYALELKLAALRRRRNALMPLNSLPPEIVGEVIQHVVDDVVNGDKRFLGDTWYNNTASPSIYHWTTVTQFCMNWRSIALNQSALWTSVCTTNLGWFKVFFKRSKDQVLYVHARSGWTKDIEFEEMLRLIVSNMHRIHSLRLDNGHTPANEKLLWLQNVPAPRLEVLKLFEPLPDSLRSVLYQVSPVVMPKLRRLRLDNCSNHDCAFILPTHLPTVTDVDLEDLDSSDQLKLLSRCSAVERLSIKFSWESDEPITKSVMLPNLKYLKLDNAQWCPFNYVTCPSLSFMDIIGSRYPDDSELANIFTYFAQALGRFIRPIHATTPRLHHLILRIYYGEYRITVNAQSDMDEDLAVFSIGVDDRPNDDEFPLFFTSVFDFAQSASIGIGLIDIGSSVGSQGLFSALHHHPHASAVSSIRIGTLFGLRCLLSFPDTHSLPSSSQTPGATNQWCWCKPCYTKRASTLLGLRTLILDIRKDEFFEEAIFSGTMIRGLDMLSTWLMDRKRKESGLEHLELWYRFPQQMQEESDNLALRIGQAITRAIFHLTMSSINGVGPTQGQHALQSFNLRLRYNLLSVLQYSFLLRMLSSVVASQISHLDAKIASLEQQLAALRRQRNSLIPLLKLPPELVTNIMKIVVEDTTAAAMEQYETFLNNEDAETLYVLRIFSWIPVTQFCAYWRGIALACPALWTNIWTSHLELFKTFLKRSRDQPLDIDTQSYYYRDEDINTWSYYYGDEDDDKQDDEYKEMLQLVVDNMYRVRSLVLRLDCLDCCLNVRRLSILSPDWEVDGTFEPVSVELSDLRHLEVSCGDWSVLDHLTFPSISRIDVEAIITHRSFGDWDTTFLALARLLEPFCARTGSLPHHFTLTHCDDKQTIRAEDSAGTDLMVFHLLGLTDSEGFLDYIDHILRLADYKYRNSLS